MSLILINAHARQATWDPQLRRDSQRQSASGIHSAPAALPPTASRRRATDRAAKRRHAAQFAPHRPRALCRAAVGATPATPSPCRFRPRRRLARWRAGAVRLVVRHADPSPSSPAAAPHRPPAQSCARWPSGRASPQPRLPRGARRSSAPQRSAAVVVRRDVASLAKPSAQRGLCGARHHGSAQRLGLSQGEWRLVLPLM